MRILAIETSCDETACAVVEDGIKIITNVVASSKELHEKTGGIIPEIAAREQIKCIIPVLQEALKFSSSQAHKRDKLKSSIARLPDRPIADIDAIAVTVGPGLTGSLLVGIETAKTIAYVYDKPIIPVNHVLAHIYANFLHGKKIEFPAIALVVSGGHTELFFMEDEGKLKWISGTLDDAAGEAFDKTARILRLGFPGGPAIAAEAAQYQISDRHPADKKEKEVRLPRPMINSGDLNFSFSGLKTAVLREVNKLKAMKQLSNETIEQLSHEIQESITDVLVKKTLAAANKYKVKSILLGGGVAANKRLTEKFKFEICNLKFEISLYIPPPFLCTDNAAYIGSFAYFNNKPLSWQNIQAQPNLEVEV